MKSTPLYHIQDTMKDKDTSSKILAKKISPKILVHEKIEEDKESPDREIRIKEDDKKPFRSRPDRKITIGRLGDNISALSLRKDTQEGLEIDTSLIEKVYSATPEVIKEKRRSFSNIKSNISHEFHKTFYSREKVHHRRISKLPKRPSKTNSDLLETKGITKILKNLDHLFKCKCKGICIHLKRGGVRLKNNRTLLKINKKTMGGEI
jgi:hypothetical protein